MQEVNIVELQTSSYFYASKKLNESKQYPLQLTIGYMNQESELDLNELREKGLLVWDASLKGNQLTTGASNPEHMVKCVVYYGNAEFGHCCVGYAIGSYNNLEQCLEIDFIEKRCDGFEDLKHEFLPIIVSTLLFYASTLDRLMGLPVSKLAFVGPLPGALNSYERCGFEHIKNYRNGQDAMVKYR